MTINHFSIGKQIRLARTIQEKKQQELADVSGVHISYISMIESGRMLPTDDQIRRLEAALGVRFNDPAVQAAFCVLSGQQAVPS